VRIEVPERSAGARLDSFLSEALGSRARAQRLIADGQITVDGRCRVKRHLLSGGELIDVEETGLVAAAPPEAGPVSFGVVHEDAALLVIDKPAGLVVHPGRGHRSGTLAQALAGRAAGGPDSSRAGIVHRLDRDTSGLMVVARSEIAHRRLREQLAAREMGREYLALVEGRPTARAGTVDAPIGRDRRVRTRMSVDTDHPREARTHFEVERVLPEQTLLRVRLETGRTHQIRVHLAAIGHPVCGDPEYGHAGLLGLSRQFLHAQRLVFVHPISGQSMDLRSPLPADLDAALARAQHPPSPSPGRPPGP